MRFLIYMTSFVVSFSFIAPAIAEDAIVYINPTSTPDAGTWQYKIDAVMKNITNASSCKKTGGTWVPMGMAGKFGCDLPTPDAGKQCTDDDQCAMICQPTNKNKNIGVCSSTYSLFGCWSGMKFGEPRSGSICID
jgi:hypothetical protein